MGGIVGRVFREFGLTIGAAVAVSALVSLSLAPMMCSRLIPLAPTGRQQLASGIAAAFNRLSAGYGRTLDVVLARRPAALCVFLLTLLATAVIAIQMPKGFFPVQDTGVISGLAVAAQGVSPGEMIRLERALGELIRRDPAVAGFASWTGSTGGNGYAQTANTARFSISLLTGGLRGRCYGVEWGERFEEKTVCRV
jgi:multidrug efflux pump subunit AcrB